MCVKDMVAAIIETYIYIYIVMIENKNPCADWVGLVG